MAHEKHSSGQALGLEVCDCRLPIQVQDAWGRSVDGPWCRLICDSRDGSTIAAEVLAEKPIDQSVPKTLQLLVSCTPWKDIDPWDCDFVYPPQHTPDDGIFTLAELQNYLARWFGITVQTGKVLASGWSEI